MKLFFGLLSLLVLMLPMPAQAGAWVQRDGGGQAILTARYQASTPAKLEINPLVEYGLSPRFTVGANLGYRAIDRDSGKSSLGYAELFGRYQVLAGRSVLSVQAMAGSAARGLNARADASLGVAEARVLWGTGFGLGGGGSGFVDAQTAFRTFFGKAGDEWRTELTLGWKFAPGWMALAQGFHTANLRQDPTIYDYNSWQAQGSLVAPLGKGWFVQAGYNKTVGGARVRFDANYFAAAWVSW